MTDSLTYYVTYQCAVSFTRYVFHVFVLLCYYNDRVRFKIDFIVKKSLEVLLKKNQLDCIVQKIRFSQYNKHNLNLSQILTSQKRG